MRIIRRVKYKWDMNRPDFRAQFAELCGCKPEELVMRRTYATLKVSPELVEKLGGASNFADIFNRMQSL